MMTISAYRGHFFLSDDDRLPVYVRLFIELTPLFIELTPRFTQPTALMRYSSCLK